jgi:kinesin family protein 18/19
LVDPVLNGFNATVFAYGPTGTGKTYTMLGDKEKSVQGISVLTIQDILTAIENDKESTYNLNVSYVEIYNENIRDLLLRKY